MPEPENFNQDYAHSIVKLQSEGKSFDRDICEREPIRTPGAIQSHGALLGIGGDSGAIVFCSRNIGEYFDDATAANVLGKDIRDFLPQTLADAIAQERASGALSAANPACFAQRLELKIPATCWVHARAGTTFIEFEKVGALHGDDGAASRLAERAIGQIRDAETLEALDAVTVAAIRKISGYERVLIYRFDEDWNGITTAEEMLEGAYQPFLGLRFPASDIPRQARELYSENLFRMMADRDADSVPVLALDAASPDLSGARLRAQSPVHLEYQRNINVNGAMSASVKKRGKLWGLVVGHHRAPHHMAPSAAMSIVNLVQSYSMRLHDLEDRAARNKRSEQQRIYAALLEQMAVRDDFVEALTSGSVGLPALLDAAGAAIVRNSTVQAFGDAPPADVILKLVQARTITKDDGVFSTDHAASWDPALAAYAKIASGILIMPLRDEQETKILWFRGGIAETVTWAGNPQKPMQEAGAQPLPRRSFERWTEERFGRSEPWTLADIEIATSLGFAIGEIILRHGRKIQALSQRLFNAERATAAQDVTEIALRTALQEKEAELQQKDFLLREVDHRVRNSLALISSMLQLQARSTLDPHVRQQFIEASRRVITVGQVHQRLYQTGELRALDFGDYLKALTADISDTAGADTNKRLVLETTNATMSAESVIPLGLIVNELVTNAFKHGEKKGTPITVNVSFAQSESGMRLTVEDDGPGLPEGFDPRKNTGLGMRLVNGLIVQLRAKLEFESAIGSGTRFTVAIPKKDEPLAALPQ